MKQTMAGMPYEDIKNYRFPGEKIFSNVMKKDIDL
jgi:hypothetical protein